MQNKQNSSFWRYHSSVFFIGMLLFVAMLEIAASVLFSAGGPKTEDWKAAEKEIRKSFQKGDLIVSAPPWTDPLLRWQLGDVMALRDVGLSSLAGYKRLWLVSVGGASHEFVPTHQPDLDRLTGKLRLRRWTLHTTARLYDFVENIHMAQADIVQSKKVTPCPWKDSRRVNGGGLLQGPLQPQARFQCQRPESWLWVGATMTEDLTLKARHCVWQHPVKNGIVRSRFPAVPIGGKLVFHGGLYYMHEREKIRPPVSMDVLLEGVKIAEFEHHDGEGWKQFTVDTRVLEGEFVDVTVQVHANEPHFRTFCWSGFSEGTR